MGFRYTAFSPPLTLQSAVDAYWINESIPTPTVLPLTQNQILPDGCIDLIFRGQSGVPDSSVPRLFISALIEEPEQIVAPPGSWYVGVRFRPAMARLVLPIPPAECRNQSLDASAVARDFQPLEQELLESPSPQAALSILRGFVDRRLDASLLRAGPPARVRRALTLLGDCTSGPGKVNDLAAVLGITQRSLHRDLVQWTGLAPKVLARIFRMQAAMRVLQTGAGSLATIAANSGYADQPHMTREFRRLTGATPAEHWRPPARPW